MSLCQRTFNAVIIKEIMKYWCRSCAKHTPCEFATPHCCCNASFIAMEDGASRERSLGRLNTHLLGVCLWEKFGCCESRTKLETSKHRLFLRWMLSDTPRALPVREMFVHFFFILKVNLMNNAASTWGYCYTFARVGLVFRKSLGSKKIRSLFP